MDFAVPADHWKKLKENEEKNKYLDLSRELKKLWIMKVTFIKNVIGALDTVTEKIGTGTRELGNNTTNGDHPNYSIAEIGQKTEMSPGDWGDLLSINLQWKKHLLTLRWKTLKE